MNSVDLGRATKRAISTVPARFMLDPATYQRGEELGFQGWDFYFAGRGGALGDTTADVVVAALAFFERGLVTGAWDRSKHVMPRLEAAACWAETAHDWARANLAEAAPEACETVVELGSKVVAAAEPAGAPVFAGWRALDVPAEAAPAAVHLLNSLRELRGGLHAGAVLAQGLSVQEAVAVGDPGMAAIHGFGELPAADGLLEAWKRAEQGTNLAVGRVLSVLDEREQEAFVEACAAVHSALR